MINGHIFGADGLRIDTIKQRNRPPSKDTRRDVARLGRLFGWLGDNSDRRRVEGSPDAPTARFSIVRGQRRRWWFGDIKRKLETLGFGCPCDMEKLEASSHIVVEGRLLLEGTLPTFGYDGH